MKNKKEAKGHNLGVRVSNAEKEMLDFLTKECNISISKLVRNTIKKEYDKLKK